MFAITGAQASQSDRLVQGVCLLAGHSLHVLYDSGATHSFISSSCVEALQLPVQDLLLDLHVSTPTAELVVASQVCIGCPLIVEGHESKVNLICLPLKDLDVILGMDWLAANRVLIDCGLKQLVFPDPADMELVTAQQVWTDLRNGA